MDMLVGAILLAAAWLGGRRGLYRSLMPLIVTIASVVCAIFVSAALTEPVTDLVYPVVEDMILPVIHLENLPTEELESMVTLAEDVTALSEKLKTLLPEEMLPMIAGLGVDLKEFLTELLGKIRDSETISEYLSEKQLTKLEGIGVHLKTVTGAVARSVPDVETILFTAVFSLIRRVTSLVIHFFLWLAALVFFRVVFTFLKNALGLTFRLPVIGWADALGGAALGFLECAVVLLVAGWLARCLGFTALHDMGMGTSLYSIFF